MSDPTGEALCFDCGTAPIHEDAPASMCKRCAIKGGDRYAFFTKIDHDKLRAKVGRDMAREILLECSYE